MREQLTKPSFILGFAASNYISVRGKLSNQPTLATVHLNPDFTKTFIFLDKWNGTGPNHRITDSFILTDSLMFLLIIKPDSFI